MALRTASVPIPSSRRFRLPRDAALGYLLLAPAIVLLLVLVGYPFLTAVLMSLQKKLIGQAAAPFIGLDNYITLLMDRTFWVVVRNVLIFAGASVALNALSTEVFPTALRATAKVWVTNAAIIGAMFGLGLVGLLADRVGGHALVIAGLAFLPMVLAPLLFVLPETHKRELEKI